MSDRHTSITLDPREVQVETRDAIPPGAVDYAREVVAAATSFANEPVLSARVKLSATADPVVYCPCTAQANINVSGQLVRAQAVAQSMDQALRLLGDRLRVRLRHTGRDAENLRGRRPEDVDHEWRRSSPHRRPLPYSPRAGGEREIVRHKAYELTLATPDEAAFDMEQFDYDFYLFTEAGTGQDSVIYHSRDGYRLAQIAPMPHKLGPVAIPLTVSSVPAPVLTVSEAVERLETTGMPFVFFADAGTGRGSLAYHRYSGHYGLIIPSG
ncbi:HPF/RaiA family ribosome-associated protein [Nonomuraea sp. MG754425]|uniref:sigma 54 modulation/S30EA ribosomal C-terminal domain-containing protein n=1 Tax=Nonomuraea sp. MG754425 TaxID=2570319 RepID=UPI001F32E11F|nr:sigma 54 modulation/S30EA ribosomal C-terminal domain-containing protein [Nonomuraea sp. MG754425]MCF6467875.1 HPF/RaiA family ribosome-associated protein [Nonomuraea sp. MG754425]